MANYKIIVKKSVAKDLRSIPNKDVSRILECINVHCENPRSEGCIKLSGQDRYRVRQGIYRIIYEIQDSGLVIFIVKVAHRDVIHDQVILIENTEVPKN